MKSAALSLDQKVPAVVARIQSNAWDPWSTSRRSGRDSEAEAEPSEAAVPRTMRALLGGCGTGQEIAAFTSPATFFSTMGLRFLRRVCHWPHVAVVEVRRAGCRGGAGPGWRLQPAAG
jgi:hypothetical protein